MEMGFFNWNGPLSTRNVAAVGLRTAKRQLGCRTPKKSFTTRKFGESTEKSKSLGIAAFVRNRKAGARLPHCKKSVTTFYFAKAEVVVGTLPR